MSTVTLQPLTTESHLTFDELEDGDVFSLVSAANTIEFALYMKVQCIDILNHHFSAVKLNGYAMANVAKHVRVIYYKKVVIHYGDPV